MCGIHAWQAHLLLNNQREDAHSSLVQFMPPVKKHKGQLNSGIARKGP
jgi:hypothetical protein